MQKLILHKHNDSGTGRDAIYPVNIGKPLHYCTQIPCVNTEYPSIVEVGTIILSTTHPIQLLMHITHCYIFGKYELEIQLEGSKSTVELLELALHIPLCMYTLI